MIKKTIKFDIYIKTSEQTPTYSYTAKQKVMSNDKDSTQITFNLLDVSPDELSGSSASILLYMQDGSFFQSSDVTIDRNSVIYTMKEEETKHSGNTKVQIVLKKGTVQTASLIYNFEIEKGLEKYPITEVMIQDWTTLTEEAKAFVEQIEGFTLEQFVENKMGQELANLEVNYATRLTGLEQKDNQLTAQLAQNQNISINAKHPPIPMVGVKGDSTTDDGQALNAILSFVKINGGGKVELPSGFYRHTEPILIPGYVTLVGTGKASTWGEGSPCKLLKDGDFDGVITDGSTAGIRDITLEGLGGRFENTGDGLYVKNGRANLSNVEITGHGGDGLKLGGKSTTSKHNANLFYFENVSVTNCGGYGLHISDDHSPQLPDAGAGMISQIDVRECQLGGIYVNGALDVIFQNPAVQHCKGWGIKLGPNCKGAKFFGFYSEYNEDGEYWIQPGARRNYFFAQRDTQPMNAFLDEGISTFILGRDNNNQDTMAINKLQFTDLQISDTDISGHWRFRQNKENRNLELDMFATSASGFVDIKSGLKLEHLRFNSGRINDYKFVAGGHDIPTITQHDQYEFDVPIAEATTIDNVILNTRNLVDRMMVNAYVKENGIVTVRVLNFGTHTGVFRLTYRLSLIKPQQ